MSQCNRHTHPWLFGYLEAYGLDGTFIDHIDRIKENGHYALVGSSNGPHVSMLDVSKSPDRMQKDYRDGSSLEHFGYNMLNDGMDPITDKDWNKVKLDKYCDGFTIPGHAEYG